MERKGGGKGGREGGREREGGRHFLEYGIQNADKVMPIICIMFIISIISLILIIRIICRFVCGRTKGH